MSYKPGDLKLTEACTHDECEGSCQCVFDGSRSWVSDSREPFFRHDDPNKPPYQKYGAYLPHSCDEWYIGGEENLTALIKDAYAALVILRRARQRTVTPGRGDM